MCSNQILLGLKDTAITTNDNTYWKTNKIGGEPDFMTSNTSIACRPTPRCQLCDRKMALAIQVYCPLGTSTYDRTLYVFCCINQSCWNKQESWQVYRTQQISHKHVVKDEVLSPKEDSWLSEESNWDDENEDNDSDITDSDISCNKVINDLCVAAEKESNIEAPCNIQECNHEGPNLESSCFVKECNPLTTKLLEMNRAALNTLPWQSLQMPLLPPDYSPVFKSYFINVIEEPPKETDPGIHDLRLVFDYCAEVNSDAGSAPPENYEKMCANDENWMFQKFVNRVSTRCQEQVIRYQWKGEPLLMTEETLPLICHYCGGPAVYELQLMPALVRFLKLESIKNEDAVIEFGTVLIFTCQNSCWEEGAEYKKEMICVQSDPDEHLFQQRI